MVIKRVARRRGFPEEIKQKKQGFTFPLARWFKKSLRKELSYILFENALYLKGF